MSLYMGVKLIRIKQISTKTPISLLIEISLHSTYYTMHKAYNKLIVNTLQCTNLTVNVEYNE